MIAADPEEQWKQRKTIIQETTTGIVGLLTSKHQDWFYEAVCPWILMSCQPHGVISGQFYQADKESQELLEAKCSCHSHLLAKPDDQAAKAACKTGCSAFQAKQND